MSGDDEPKEVEPSAGGILTERLRNKTFGEAAEGFGKEIAPLGPAAGKLLKDAGLGVIALAQSIAPLLGKGLDWLSHRVQGLSENIPKEKVVSPDPRILGPMILDLGFAMNEESIREMYAKLAAADMNSDTKAMAHPSFVEIIKQMTPADARVLQAMPNAAGIHVVRIPVPSGGESDLTQVPTIQVEGLTEDEIILSFSNLDRLELVTTDNMRAPVYMIGQEAEILARYKHIQDAIRTNPGRERVKLQVQATGVFITPIGQRFKRVCIS